MGMTEAEIREKFGVKKPKKKVKKKPTNTDTNAPKKSIFEKRAEKIDKNSGF